MAGFEARAEILIEAGTDRVWAALADPKLIKQYLFGTDVVSNWEVGSPISYRGLWEGKPYEDKGIILELVPEKRLVSTYWSSMSGLEDIPENYSKVSYFLDKEGEGTRLRLVQDNNATQEAAAHSRSNWVLVLKALKQVVEEPVQ
jgi:uncharacterized protein YndB with AHSA1/START domain